LFEIKRKFFLKNFLGFFIPESPRFLAVKGDLVGAGKVLETIATKTGSKLESNFADELGGLTKFGEQNKNETQKRTIADLFKTRPIRNGKTL